MYKHFIVFPILCIYCEMYIENIRKSNTLILLILVKYDFTDLI